MPKSGFEDILKMCTEIGIDFIQPLFSERQVNKNFNFSRKMLRWNSIIKEAVEQSERLWNPSILYAMDIIELLKSRDNQERVSISITWEETLYDLNQWLRKQQEFGNKKGGIFWNVIGPEGGWSSKEIDFFKKNNKVCFLIGFPRSGTTLLDTVLRSHPEIDVIEEKPIIYSLEKIIKNQFKYQLDEIYKLNEIEVEKLRKYYLENILRLSDKKNAQIIIDKFPLQTVSLPLINFIFPKAKIIFAHRHPYDTVLSCFQQSFEPNNAMANFRSLKESSEIYNLSMKMWVKYKKNLNLDYTMSKYESLINNFEIHTKKIMNFLEIEWDSNIKNYRETALRRQKINTPSSSQVVQPIYKSSIAKWENYKTYFDDCHVFLEEWIKYFEY